MSPQLTLREGHGPEADAEAQLLERADPARHTIAFGVGTILSAGTHAALDRLILRGWLRLIDLTPEGNGSGRFVRHFLVTSEARAWLRNRNGDAAREKK